MYIKGRKCNLIFKKTYFAEFFPYFLNIHEEMQHNYISKKLNIPLSKFNLKTKELFDFISLKYLLEGGDFKYIKAIAMFLIFFILHTFSF